MNEPIVAVGLSEVSSDALVEELRRRGGFRIQSDDGRGWMAPGDLCREIGRYPDWLGKLLRRGIHPIGLEVERTAAGRLLRVRPSPEFRAWAAARVEPQPSLL